MNALSVFGEHFLFLLICFEVHLCCRRFWHWFGWVKSLNFFSFVRHVLYSQSLSFSFCVCLQISYCASAKHFIFKRMPNDFVFISVAAAVTCSSAVCVCVFSRIVFRSTSVNDIVQWSETADTWSVSNENKRQANRWKKATKQLDDLLFFLLFIKLCAISMAIVEWRAREQRNDFPIVSWFW